MDMHEKGKAVQESVELRKLNTLIKGEEEKLALKKNRFQKLTKKHRIWVMNREIRELELKLNRLYKEKKLIEENEEE
ncbi:hypothetical protein [Alkalicoccus daliensis]|uniref:Uncharacterized protein n=1 Tax=Alkalicoccus daliensis TaxID=745820 RepID=A0A1G9ZC10_9BACI|nr:hypothetical protein [Alkalicoccus daliensis]SDN18804.1 hypothetical protein SAMN04488053_10138 [Alkalicoccus daliensis]